MKNQQQNADINPDFSTIILYANRLNTPTKRKVDRINQKYDPGLGL